MITAIKIFLKEYLPFSFYRALYFVWRKIIDLLYGKSVSSRLISFTSKRFVKLSIGTHTFSLLIDPLNGGVDNSIFLFGPYEKDMLELMSQIINHDDVCLDIGANIGQHSILMALVAKDGEVHSYEPNKRLVGQFSESLKKNDINNVVIHEYGLGEKEDVSMLYSNNLNVGMSSVIRPELYSSKEEIIVKKFDSEWDSSKKVSFIKMDIEGYEVNAFRGMEQLIRRDNPSMIVEYNPAMYSDNDKEFLTFLIFDVCRYSVYSLSDLETELSKDQFLKLASSNVYFKSLK
ncbi:MAG: hypothetical protein RLZZ308_123 [Candidatus Parcubacteria bacterium]|jgi:FkbM family methyltransferase